MPKTYSDAERVYIKKRLLEEASDCLLHYGVRRTTVDELVRRVQIPKGTFYLFYQTKELLLFEVLLQQHDRMETQLLAEIHGLRDSMTADTLTDTLFRFYKAADDSGVLRLLTTGEIELLYRKLPPKVVQEHFSHDSDLVRKITALLPVSENVPVEALSAAFRNLFISMIYKREMGEEFFDDALKLTIRGLVLQLKGNDSPLF